MGREKELIKTDVIWMNGKLIPWEQATLHVLSHVVHYGTSWFEGIRCYETSKGSAIFQLHTHLERLFASMRIYRTNIQYSLDQLAEAVIETIRANKLKSCYIRPLVFRGFGEMGVNPINCPVETVIAVWEWGNYLGKDSLDEGIDVMVSSWNRFAPNTLPAMAKAGGNYLNAQLVKMEALHNGYREGIALDSVGNLSEGSGENIFIVKKGVLYTPTFTSSILPGITRNTVITLAQQEQIEIKEVQLPRESLYVADEVFFTGTAAEITPIRSIDKIAIGTSCPGPVTKLIQKHFFDITREGNDSFGWLTWL
jgi:branched-chain amino acid aminotransferase